MSTEARNRTREMRAAREAAERARKRRVRILAILGSTVVLALVVAIVAVLVNAARDDGAGAAGGKVVRPAGATADGAIPVGSADAPTTLGIYYDYMCPACGLFEQANGEEVSRLVEAGEVKLELRPISFLDRYSSGTRYSTRAANAFATVADGAPEQLWEFHAGLYADQPEEGSEGLSDEQIADIALEAGVPQEVVDRFADATYEGWVASVSEDALRDIEGTPTVTIDGTVFDGNLYTPGPLTEALEAAAGSD